MSMTPSSFFLNISTDTFVLSSSQNIFIFLCNKTIPFTNALDIFKIISSENTTNLTKISVRKFQLSHNRADYSSNYSGNHKHWLFVLTQDFRTSRNGNNNNNKCIDHKKLRLFNLFSHSFVSQCIRVLKSHKILCQPTFGSHSVMGFSTDDDRMS